MDEVAAELARVAVASGQPFHRSPIFVSAAAPLLTNRATDRISRGPSGRGETLPLADLAPPGEPRGPPSRPSARIRRDTRVEVEVVRRRRSQVAVAAVLGILFVAILSGIVAAMASRSGPRAARPDPSPAPAAAVSPPASPPAMAVPPSAEAAAPARQESATASRPGEAAASASDAPREVDAAVEPPPSASASAPPKATRARRAKGAGVPPGAQSGENPAPANDLIDPYGPGGR
jgi:hypothetical protein